MDLFELFKVLVAREHTVAKTVVVAAAAVEYNLMYCTRIMLANSQRAQLTK